MDKIYLTKDKKIRMASEADAEALLAIYEPYITNTSITFEYKVPTLEEFKQRIINTLELYPWIVFEEEGLIVGYAYASAYAPREAFKWSTSLSIYIQPQYQHKGIAAKLYDCLISLLKQQGFYTAYALITSPNVKSEKFHTKRGFSLLGIFPNIGFKQGEWRSVTYMQLILNEYKDKPIPPKSINELIKQTH